MARSLLLWRRSQLPVSICRIHFRQLSQSASSPNVPAAPARTRFAPSPTGYLHLGSLRTALFSYLLAKRTGGQFILRIEDTDRKRTVPDAEQRIVQDLQWAQLQWDEGPDIGGPKGPYRQSERTNIYRAAAQILLNSGDAYYCFCSPSRLNALAQHQHKLGLPTDYDRTCASISATEADERVAKGEAHTVRFKIPSPCPAYHDLIHGVFKPFKRPAHVTQSSFEDPILIKSDGYPTYHLANVVDDHLMEITHVIRGSEWMNSTCNHVAMYNAFGWAPPQFAHVGLLVDSTGNKLSKRNFDTDISAFKEMELFPETLTNFAALLGWSHREKSDVMDLQTLTKNFSLKFTKGNTTVTFGKMHFLQRKHALARVQAGGDKLQEMVDSISTLLASPDSPYPGWASVATSSPFQPRDRYIAAIIQADAENYTNSNEFLFRNAFFFHPLPSTIPTQQLASSSDLPERSKMFALLSTDQWTRESLVKTMHGIIDGRPGGRENAKDVYHYLRTVLTGQEQGMRIYDILLILGREEILRRLGYNEEDEGRGKRDAKEYEKRPGSTDTREKEVEKEKEEKSMSGIH